METIRICKDRNLLREFLESREKEVVSIMMTLFDEERIRRNYAASERREAVRDFTELLICIIFEKFRANGKAENPQFIGIRVCPKILSTLEQTVFNSF